VKAVSFASLLVRGVALWLVCNGIANLSLIYLYRPGYDMAMAAILNSTLLPIMTGVVVWSSASWLAERMASSEPTSSVAPNWTPEEALRVAVAIVGLVIFTDALRDLVWQTAFYVKLHWAGPSSVFGAEAEANATANRISALVRAILGAVLVLRPAAAVAVVGRAEGPGRPAEGEGASGGRTRG